jgi:hypothetical protein
MGEDDAIRSMQNLLERFYYVTDINMYRRECETGKD